MARWMKKLPYRELGVPLKMAKGWFVNRAKRVTPFREITVPHGSLQIIDGVPLVHVRGTHREMGQALGNLVGVQAFETFHSYMRCFAPDFEGDLKLAREMEPNLPQWMRDEMRGFSETSELTYDEMLVGQCFLDIHKVAACSTIAAHDGMTESGEILMGRNLDFPSLSIAHEANIVVVYEPTESGREKGSGTAARSQTPFRYASVTWPGLLGALTGINDRGLALSMMLVYGHQKREHLDGLPFPTLFRQLLKECGTVREGDAVLQTKPHCTATNLILADASRTAARFQLPPHDVVVDYTSADQPAAACTNHYHERRIKKFAFTWFSSKLRYGKIAKKIAADHKWTVQSIKDVLQATGIPPINIQRTIMRPEELSLEVSFKNNGRGPGHWVKLPRELLFPKQAVIPTESHTLAHTGA
ncbi:MAG: C45 family peptidase [Planctomycetes bacterium]|nr:C45 family peptidase [Planctomycetota bacterium]